MKYLAIFLILPLLPASLLGENIVLIALDDVTVIAEANGTRLYAGTLSKGDTETIEDVPGATLRFSKGSALEIQFGDDKVRPSIRGMGQTTIGSPDEYEGGPRIVSVQATPRSEQVITDATEYIRNLAIIQFEVRIDLMTDPDRVRKIAEATKAFQDALVEAGFTPDQALQIVCSQQLF